MVRTERRRVGDVGEGIACIFLERKGYRILDRNYRRKWGEIDIVAQKAACVHFIEVKSFSRENLSGVAREKGGYSPEELAHAAKLRKVARTAEGYMAEKRMECQFQIDVIAIELNERERKAFCRYYPQVLE